VAAEESAEQARHGWGKRMKNPHTPKSSLFDVEPRARRDISLAVARGALKIAALTALIGRCVVGAILGVAIAITIPCPWGRAALAGEAVPEEGRGMEAIARVFALAEHIRDVEIVLNKTAELPWSEAILLHHWTSPKGRSTTTQWYLKQRPGTTCTYDLAQAHVDPTNRQEMVVDMSQSVRSIAFDRLSTESETRFSYPIYYRFDVLGQPGAVCQLDGRRYRCHDRLMTLLMLDELRSMKRVLRFIFANVCAPATLPFDQ
jgi:hypothetical protein